MIDTNYRNQKVPTDHNLDQALLRVYSAILDFTVEVKKGLDENEASKIMTLYFSKRPRSFEADCIQERTFQSVMALTDQPLQILKDVINSQAELAKKWTELAANLGELQMISGLWKSTNGIQGTGSVPQSISRRQMHCLQT